MKQKLQGKIWNPASQEILLAVTVGAHWWLGLPVPSEAHQVVKWILLRLVGK